jgi:hypothetical protein
MMNVSEVVCTELQNGPVVEIAQGADKGGTGTGELFALLLAALGGGLFVPQGDATAVLPTGEEAAQSGVCIENDVAVQSDVSAQSGGAALFNVPAEGVGVSDGTARPHEAVGPSVTEAAGGGNAVRVPEGEARASPAHAASAQQGSDEGAPLQVIPAVEESAGELPLVSVEAPAKAAPVYSQASPAGDGIADEQIVASAQAAKSASATANVVRSATNVVTGESRVSAPAEAAVETEAGAQQHALPNGSSTVQSGFATARAELEPGAEDNAATGMHHEAESDASQPGRGSADRLFLETLAQAQDGRARGVVNVTRNEASPVGNSGEARLTESIVGQTVRSVVLSARGGSSELRVRMWPEHLGELHLRLVFKDNVLTLDLNTQSTVVKNVIEGNLAQLRYALQHNGVDVGKVSVMVDPDLASGGRFSRQTPVFHPFEDRWHRSFSGQQPEQDSSPAHWFRGARRRHVLCRIDLVA